MSLVALVACPPSTLTRRITRPLPHPFTPSLFVTLPFLSAKRATIAAIFRASASASLVSIHQSTSPLCPLQFLLLLHSTMETIQFMLEDFKLDRFLPGSYRLCAGDSRRISANSIESLDSVSSRENHMPRQWSPSTLSSPNTNTTTSNITTSTLPMASANCQRQGATSPKAASTSTKSPYLRLRPSSPKLSSSQSSHHSSSFTIPRFNFTMNSLLVFSCLLCITVPTGKSNLVFFFNRALY